MYYLAIIALLIGTASRVQAQDTLTVIGTVSGAYLEYPKIYVYGADIRRDSAEIIDGRFIFNIPYKPGIVPLFYTEYALKVNKTYRPLPAIVDRPGTLYLEGLRIDKDIHEATWSGISSAAAYQTFDNRLQQALAGLSSRDSLATVRTRDHILAFVRSNPSSYASAYILSVMGKMTLGLEDISSSYMELSAPIRDSPIGADLRDYIQGLRRASIGATVPDFELDDPNGATVRFGALRGKYIIVDFWASWCGPCIKSFPHLRGLREKYEDKPFEIFGISIDQNREFWLEACEELKLPWLLAHDTKGISTRYFGVHSIPTAFLVDPDGRVLAKEIGIDASGNGDIEKKLIEIFGK